VEIPSSEWLQIISLHCLSHSSEEAFCLRRSAKHVNFDVLLTVHLSIILVSNQLNAQNLVL